MTTADSTWLQELRNAAAVVAGTAETRRATELPASTTERLAAMEERALDRLHCLLLDEPRKFDSA